MNIRQTLLVSVLAVSVAACSTVEAGLEAISPSSAPESHVAGGLSATDARAVSSSIVDFVSLRLSAAGGAVQLIQAPGDGLLAPLIADDLRAGGYQVHTTGSTPGVHSLAYQVGEMDGGVLIRLSLDRRLTAARLLKRNAKMGGGLRSTGPYTIMEARR